MLYVHFEASSVYVLRSTGFLESIAPETYANKNQLMGAEEWLFGDARSD